jgi:hypothetical protein
MYFSGRWVPMHLANTIFILWLIACALVIGLILYLNHRAKRNSDPKPPLEGMRLRRRKRKR